MKVFSIKVLISIFLRKKLINSDQVQLMSTHDKSDVRKSYKTDPGPRRATYGVKYPEEEIVLTNNYKSILPIIKEGQYLCSQRKINSIEELRSYEGIVFNECNFFSLRKDNENFLKKGSNNTNVKRN